MNTKLLCSLFFLFLSTLVNAQQLPVDRHTQNAYQKHSRDHSGLPGRTYWQNRGDYNIDIRFSPATRKIEGSVKISYYNNSQDTLSSLGFKLYPNLYKANSMRNTAISKSDLGPGMHLGNILVADKKIDSNKRIIRGTNMTIRGVHILPHEQTSVEITFDYILNEGSFNRTGQIIDGTYFIAYFFPRIAVYDDIDGWNEYQYLGKEEFYNDYGNFKVSITLPSAYCVWATGELKNQNEIYQDPILARISSAESTDAVVDVITQDDIDQKRITIPDSIHTWKFEANNVTDFAFAASRNYIWKSSSVVTDSISKKRTRVDAVYLPGHKSYIPVVGYIAKTVHLISHVFPAVAFPYPHLTIVDGLDAMEYPMMVNNLPFEDPKDVVEFTAHEVFHTIFPFYVGTNETKYSFMDEGWATMTEFMFHPYLAPQIPLHYDLGSVNDYAGLAEDVPVMTPTAQLYGNTRYADKDLKPALALWYLKDMLGDRKFAEATRNYIQIWAGKHPSPYDFFNCMNKGIGINLNWYWDRWYFKKAVPDLAISRVGVSKGQPSVTISNIGGAPVPIHLIITYSNGKSLKISKKVTVWQHSSLVNIPIANIHKINSIVLGDQYDADINPKDNEWVTGKK